MIYVCDAIMGSGKTESAISLMNSRPDGRFIYVTPYLDEAARIKESCPDKCFAEPKRLPEFKFSKSLHTMHLIEMGLNVTSTHQAFSYYTGDTLRLIRDSGYTLIVDESMEVLQEFKFSRGDLEIATRAGIIDFDGRFFRPGSVEYRGSAYAHMMRLFRSRICEKVEEDSRGTSVAYWALPADLLLAFEDVYVLTYLFEGQNMHYFFKMNDLSYQKIGVCRTEDGGFEFSMNDFWIPEYVSSLGDYIHICQHEKLNRIGHHRTALSMNWMNTNKEGREKLKKHIYNYFTNIMKEFDSSQRMWGCGENYYGKLRGLGYTKGFVVFNDRATNKYRHKRVLAYACNIFMNVDQKEYFSKHNVRVDEDSYALSTMIQWIWRSAIRDGKEIWIYVPSRRMRTLLENWIELTSASARAAGTAARESDRQVMQYA